VALLGDVVAGERDNVRLKAIGSFDCPFNLPTVGKRAVVNVGKLYDPKPVEGFGQAIKMNLFMLDREHVRLTERGASNVRQAQSQGT
jgi:hypothetical protein